MTTSRFDYVKYDDLANFLQAEAKRGMISSEKTLDLLPNSREKSLAITKLEEAYMWIGKAIRDDQVARNGSAELQEGRKDG